MDEWGPLSVSVKSEPWTCCLPPDDHFPVPDTNNSLRLLGDPMHSVGSAPCGEPGPLGPLLDVATGIPSVQCSRAPCVLHLCSPQREGAQAPSAQHRCGSPQAPAQPGRAVTGLDCRGTAVWGRPSAPWSHRGPSRPWPRHRPFKSWHRLIYEKLLLAGANLSQPRIMGEFAIENQTREP